MSIVRTCFLLLGMTLLAGHAAAAEYPDHPVKIIVPFAAGGPTDTVARILASKLSDALGKQFYVEDQPGAGGNRGMGNAARSAADGYTLIVVSSSFVVNPSLYASVPYDPEKDFAPITMAADTPNVFMINPEFPAKNLQELIGVLRADPGKYSFASAGIGTTPHLSGELFKLSAGVDIVHVPFNGGSPAVQSVVAGHTPIGFTALPPAAPLVKAGQLRAVAVTGKTRSPALPEVPTMAEAGFPNQEADTMQGVLAPARTPKPILDLLHREIAKIVHEPDVQEKIAALGFAAVGNSPEEFSAHIKAEIAKWAQVIKQANIHIE